MKKATVIGVIIAVLCLLGGVAACTLFSHTSSQPEVIEKLEQLPSVSHALNSAWSPDGLTILYQSEGIRTIDADGGNPRYLCEGSDPTWNPDGSRICFVSDNGLETMSTEGREMKLLVNLAQVVAALPSDAKSADIYSPIWSPDGSMIAFQVRAHAEEHWLDGGGWSGTEIDDIWVVNADGSDPRQVTTDPARDWDPAWDPDSRRMAFISDSSGNWDIWVAKVDVSELRQLTTNTATDWEPSWSPDGSKIAFSSGEEDHDIWVMDADGSNKTQLTSGSGSKYHPTWSPDGSMIAFDSIESGPIGDIWIMKADGGEKTKLTSSSRPWFTCEPRWVQFKEPRWSPDGTKILFPSGIHKGNETWGYDKLWVLEFKQENRDLR